MRVVGLFVCAVALVMTGCGAPVSSVVPSATGTPNSMALLGNIEFVSVQGTGQIFTYDTSSGVQVRTGPPYATPCQSPSGMAVVATTGGEVLAVLCYDTGMLLTLAIGPGGALSPLGAVGGLATPYPGIALDGTDVYIPLFGVPGASAGAVARVSVAVPANPVVTGMAGLTGALPGTYVNPGFLTVSGGYVYVSAGSESAPQTGTSVIEVLNEATLMPVGSPFVVPHSPQQLAIVGNVAYTTIYDAAEVESIDISNPASLKMLGVLSLASGPVCHPLPVLAHGSFLYVGCYEEDMLVEIDASQAGTMRVIGSIPGIGEAQNLRADGPYLLVLSSAMGGSVYEVALGW
jgi:hypothetical protein